MGLVVKLREYIFGTESWICETVMSGGIDFGFGYLEFLGNICLEDWYLYVWFCQQFYSWN